MNPRASMPTTLSTTTLSWSSRPAAASAVMIAEKAWWSASTGVMSLNVTPCAGQSGTSTVRRVSASCAVRRSGIARVLGSQVIDRGVDLGDGCACDLDLGAGSDLEAGTVVGDPADGAEDAGGHHHALADLDAVLEAGDLLLPALLGPDHHEPEQGHDGDQRQKCGEVIHGRGSPRDGGGVSAWSLRGPHTSSKRVKSTVGAG